jgi:glucokinase
MPRYALAIDFGGTKVQSALVDENGAVLEQSVFRAPTGGRSDSDEILASVARVIWQTLSELTDVTELIGVGIGAAGPVDFARGLVSPLNLPAWRDYPLKQQIAELIPQLIGRDVPVTLAIDGLAITLAEHWIGAAQGVDNVMGMVVSTGIGGGLILDGRPVLGKSGNAGHIGHLDVAGLTGDDTYGSTTTLESIASGPHTVSWAQGQGWQGERGEELAEAYASGDDVAKEAVRRSGTAIGQAVAGASALLDLELVAIGGGFSKVAPELIERVREVVSEHYFPYVARVVVVESALGDNGPLIGAAALVHRADILPSIAAVATETAEPIAEPVVDDEPVTAFTQW